MATDMSPSTVILPCMKAAVGSSSPASMSSKSDFAILMVQSASPSVVVTVLPSIRMTPSAPQSNFTELDRLVPVHRVIDLTVEAKAVEREMALVKVAGTGDKRVEALRLSDAFRARVIDTTHSSFVFEVTGAPDKIDAFIGLMRPLGLVDVSRTGVVAIARGPEAM